MSSSVNKVILVGNLGKDPELSYSQAGTPICKFSVATSQKWMDKTTGELKEKTEWTNITVFGTTGGACSKFLKKGSKVYLEGRLQTDTWEGEDGVKKYFTNVIAHDVCFLGKKPAGASDDLRESGGFNQSQGFQQQGSFNSNGFGPGDDDVPF